METQKALQVKGMFRVNITEGDKIVGDSEWIENQVVNLGFNNYLCQLLGDMAGSQQVTHMALGTGTEPGASDTSLQGEVEKRQGVTASSSSSSKTIRFLATFASGDGFVTTTQNLQNIALVNTSSGGTIFSGNTYTASSCATNQNVNCTYDVIFS